MAGAYAALVSLSTVIDNLQNHPNPPISLAKQQVEALVGKIAFLQEFLEAYSHNEAIDGLGSLIRDAAYAAEDVIESYLVDQIRGSMSSVNGGYRVYQDLQKVMEDMEAIEKKSMEIKDKIRDEEDHQHISSTSAPSLVSPSPNQKSIMVGFDGVLNEILHKLTGYESSNLEIIPISGMGGIGKTTLAHNAYEHARTVDHFDIRRWVTISQKYKLRNILGQIIFPDPRNDKDIVKAMGDINDEQFGEMIYHSFFGRRYLIVLDDVWSTEVWDEVKHFFPKNNNGSKIIITTRIAHVAFQLSNCTGAQLDFLNKEESWNLLCKTVFDEDACPFELEEIGKVIAKNCKGLPLCIVVIGGLLKKSEQTKEYWEYIARNTSSAVNQEEDERSLKILYTSYRQLPMHLKSCFLYMGVYSEDARIRVTWLAKLLVAEGFLKPIGSKMMEDVAKEYIKELADRNLILIDGKGSTGGMKYCKIHDVLRDLCLREAQREKFLSIVEEKIFCPKEGLSTQRRIVAHRATMEESSPQAISVLQSALHARSIFIGESLEHGHPWYFNSRFLRILEASDHADFFSENKINPKSDRGISEMYNLRFLSVKCFNAFTIRFGYSLSKFWNLQTLTVWTWQTSTAPVDIWKLPLLRHVRLSHLYLPNPPNDNIILWNLQSLSSVCNFICSKGVVERIPNIKKLEIVYDTEDYSDFYLDNIQHLHKLEHLCFSDETKPEARMSNLQQKLVFPPSLKKLFLGSKQVHWEDVSTLLGSLPSLEKLELDSITGSEWRPLEGQFLRLRRLDMTECCDLKYWMASSTHFPVLENLQIWDSLDLEEIPSDIGEIPTLLSIKLKRCSDSAVISAKKIAEEQEELGNSKLKFSITITPQSNELKSLASHNFKVRTV